MPRVRIATYNVLSSHLAEPTHFTRCAAEDLAASTRLPRVLAKLRAETRARSVIALQEISMDWTGELHSFFAAEGYHFVTALYGRFFNGYMGVGLAWPLADYECADVAIKRIADTRSWPRAPPQASGSLVTRLLSLPGLMVGTPVRAFTESLTWLLAGSAPAKHAPPFGGGIVGSPLNVARDRQNQAIAAMLVPRAGGAPFVVACYHMPCMFKTVADRQVMLIHASLYAQWAQKFAATAKRSPGDGSCAPHVVVGDYNVTPVTPAYALLTGGAIALDHPERPPAREPHDRTRWEFDALPGGPMRSAYALANGGVEPDFTNNAWIGEAGPAFRETLDYIFVSREWRVDGVLPLPPRDGLADDDFYPNAAEPSDHLMLAANLSLPSAGGSESRSASRSAY
jgi:endonuclease/exonuclease/phosphatase family metal-dependent hydrolase